MRSKSISIIIPTLNEEDYLPLLLQSIQRQTLLPKEIIVADAFSTDKTRKIAKEYGCKIVNGGKPGMGRNIGAKIAKGEYLLFLDADVILPSVFFLEDALRELKMRKLAAASWFIKPISSLRVDHLLFKLANNSLKAIQRIYPHAMGYCLFVKKEIHKKIKGFDESLYLCEDHDYVRRVAKVSRFGFLLSHKILVSIRRQQKEGRLKLLTKYALAEIYMLVLGPIREPIYQYEFGKFSELDEKKH